MPEDNHDETEAQHEKRLAQEQRAKLLRQRDVDALKFVMGHKLGRWFVWRQLEQHGVYRSSLSTDLITMAAREGLREGGLTLLAAVHEHTPERYAEMTKEASDGRSTRSSG